MKKIIILFLIIIAGFFIWRYFGNPDRKQTMPEKAAEAVGDYIPSQIYRKNAMEKSINENMQKENERIQNTLKELN